MGQKVSTDGFNSWVKKLRNLKMLVSSKLEKSPIHDDFFMRNFLADPQFFGTNPGAPTNKEAVRHKGDLSLCIPVLTCEKKKKKYLGYPML